MGSGDWFKAMIHLKKRNSKKSTPTSAKCSSVIQNSSDSSTGGLVNVGSADRLADCHGIRIQEIAAIRIQTAFRAYKARKTLRRLKGIVRLQMLTQKSSMKRQATTTLGYLHSWSKIQFQVKARRLFMVTEGRLKQKKLENQLKLEAKLHDLDVEWCGGSDTMDEILARIHNREEAAVKRERAMAYAFNHQWRANSNTICGSNPYELGKANWGWSWMERWIAARPWESRMFIISSPRTKQSLNRRSSKKGSCNASGPSPHGKVTPKPRRLSYPASEKGSSTALAEWQC